MRGRTAADAGGRDGRTGRRHGDVRGEDGRGGLPADLVVERGTVALVLLGRHVEREGDHPQHLHLQVVHLGVGDAAHTRVVGIVVIEVVKEFGGKHYAGDEQAVDVERGDDKLRVVLHDEVHVDEREDHRLLGNARILEDPVDEVVADADGWRLGGVEGGDFGGGDGQLVVSIDKVRQQLCDHLHDALGAARRRSGIRCVALGSHAVGRARRPANLIRPLA
mmetsp:Transcript_124/g.398  ORF Transcript_124/g.398 Transcript_124/m.398 type:complete len:221 (-) Transcript_124:183-845(-)